MAAQPVSSHETQETPATSANMQLCRPLKTFHKSQIALITSHSHTLELFLFSLLGLGPFEKLLNRAAPLLLSPSTF